MNHKPTKITIQRLALDGDGIGRMEAGQAAFIPYTLPNETVVARPLVLKKNHSRWLPLQLTTASPDRITPRCRYHFKPGNKTPWCGGCDWQHMSTSKQAQAKRQLVMETLERLGGVNQPLVTDTIQSPEDWRYRNKVQVPFGKQGHRVVAGFFSPGSHDIVDFDDCLIQPTASVQIVNYVKDQANRLRWPAYNEDTNSGWLRHLLVRTNQKGDALVVFVTKTPRFYGKEFFIQNFLKRFPFVIGVHQNVQSAHTNVILGRQWIPLWGKDRIEEKVAGLRLQYSPGSFFQVNRGAAELLYQRALEELEITSSSTIIDLYGGVGAMALLAAQKAKRSVGVEPVPSAIRDARENARINRISNVDFIESDAESFIHPRSKYVDMFSGARPRVIVDPPRSGCSLDVIHGLLRLNPERLVYVSCHPATLARDIKLLSGHYKLVKAIPVDLFPQTSHIETIARLERRMSS